MRRFNILFISALCALTMISFSSCDDFLRIFDRQDYSGSDSSCVSNGDSPDDSTQVSNGDSTLKVSTIDMHVQKMQIRENEQDSIISELSSKLGNLEKKDARKIESSTVYALMMFEFIIVLGILYFLIRNIGYSKKNNSNTMYDNSHTEGRATKEFVRTFVKQEIGDLTRQINTKNESQDKAISSIDTRIKKLEKNNDAYSGYYPTTKQDNDYQYPSMNTNPSGKKEASTFYMPRTLISMQFEDSKKSFLRSENTYFKFVIMREGQALFTFDPYDETCVKRAFDDRDNSLATVCDIELQNAQPRSYVNGENGIAVLKNGIWEVTRKLKLQYV